MFYMVLGCAPYRIFWSARFYDGEKYMSQIDKVLVALTSNPQTPGLTAAMIVKRTGVPKATVAKRVHDLRNEGYEIYTNYRMRNGKRKAYYRIAS
jgi:biotin operon repressor